MERRIPELTDEGLLAKNFNSATPYSDYEENSTKETVYQSMKFYLYNNATPIIFVGVVKNK